ncbi:MAG: PAS domain-containing protein [Blastocatellia bacterium]
MQRTNRRLQAVRYGESVIIVLLIFAIRLALQPILGNEAPLLLFTIAVALCTWRGGRGPGLLALVLSLLLADFFFIQPVGELSIRQIADGIRLLVFVIFGLIVSQMNSRWINQKRARLLSEAETQSFFELTSLGQAQADPVTGKFLRVNNKLCEMVGYPAAELLEMSFFDLTHPDDRASNADQWKQFVQGRRSEFTIEKRYVRRDGSIIWVFVNARGIFDEQGQLVRTLAAILDISDRRQAEEALRESRETLSLAMKSSRMGAWMRNMVTDEVRWDEELEALFGLPPGGFGGSETAFYELVHRDDRIRISQEIQRAIAEHRDYIIEFRFYHADGSLRWMEGRGRAVYAPDGTPLRLCGIGLDITWRKQIEQEREQLLSKEQRLREVAEAANRSRDEFLAVVSHELRSPLNAILGYTRLLRFSPHDTAQVSQSCEVIERSARTQLRLVEDLLDTARIISGKLRLDAQPTDLALVLATALDVVRPAAETKGIELRAHYHLKPGIIIGDPLRLQQIVWNLLSNAIKFTSAGGVIELRLERADQQVRIVVSDTGCGIEPEFLPRIFDRFSQSDSSSTRRHSGLGLGLSLVKHLVELHGGSIEATSPGAGQGSVFTVLLPLLSETGKPVPAIAERPPESALPLPEQTSITGYRVLVVDDQDDARTMITALLNQCGAITLSASSAADALSLLTSLPDEDWPHVLVSDLSMPEQDGCELLAQLRALENERRIPPSHQIPAVALTAFTRSEDRLRALTAGFRMHLAKPVEPAELIMVIATLITQRSWGTAIK